MGFLDGGGAALFASVLSGTYLDATLHRSTITKDGAGGGSQAFVDEPVKAQLEAATEAMRQSGGFVETDQRILVLAHGVARPDTDAEITVGGQRWSIANVGRDPCAAYWDLHGRRA